MEIFVVTAPGLEDITARELTRLGHRPVDRHPGGLTLAPVDETTARETLTRLNVHLATASRVLVRLAGFRAAHLAELERKAVEVPWDRILDGEPDGDADPRIRVEVRSRKSRLYHTGAIEERIRRGMRAALAGRGAWTPERTVPAQRIVVRVLRDRFTISADASGDHLHRRGYRQAVARAPLRETLAAAMLQAAGWEGRTGEEEAAPGEVPTGPVPTLFDPFCGSGTLILEAARAAAGIPPGAGRRFAFQAWPLAGAGSSHQTAAPSVVPDPSPPHRLPVMVGSDRDAGAIRMAGDNARRAGVAEWVDFQVAPLSGAPFPSPPGLLVTNPPYGHRVGDADRLRDLYARLGERVRRHWSGGRVVLLSADDRLAGQLGLDLQVLFRTQNGGIDVHALSARIP